MAAVIRNPLWLSTGARSLCRRHALASSHLSSRSPLYPRISAALFEQQRRGFASKQPPGHNRIDRKTSSQSKVPASKGLDERNAKSSGARSSGPKASSRDQNRKSAAKDIEWAKPPRGFEDLFEQGSPLSRKRKSRYESYSLTEMQLMDLTFCLKIARDHVDAVELKRLQMHYMDFCQTGKPKQFKKVFDLKDNLPVLDVFAASKQAHEMQDKLIEIAKMPLPDADEEKDVQKSEGQPNMYSPFDSIRSKDKKEDQNEEEEKKKKKKLEEMPGLPFPGKPIAFIKIDMTTVLVTCLLTYLTYRLLMPGENSKEITWQEFKTTFLDKGLVDKLTVVNGKTVRVDLHREATAQMYPESPAQHSNFRYTFSIGSVEAFERKLDDAQRELRIPSSERIPVTYRGETIWLSTLLTFGPTLLFLAGILAISRRSTGGGGAGGIFGIGKSKAKKFNQDSDVKVRFHDVAGMDEAKQEIMEFVSFLKEPGQYQRLGAKIPRGALLSGPPGTGKTMLAKATAGEANVPFFSISGSEFVEIFVGVGASRVRDLFATARKNTPCIIFIDEIDAVGKARGKGGNFSGGNDEREGTLNQILTEMDGFNTSEQVVVLAGTNRPDVLDQALLRPGRFDRHIAIDRPTTEGRKQIFNVHLKTIVTREDVEYMTGRLAALTPGFSGADIANCVNEAALIAARMSAEAVVMKHFEQAIERTIGGLEKKSLVLNKEERKTVAYHEAGHAICGWYFKYADPLLKVSIIPRGKGALGYAQYLPAGDVYLMNVNQLMDRMAMALGGRVSEELHFDTVTSGASDDFNKVTRMATSMVTKWGMSDMGNVYYEDDPQQSFTKPFSEHTAQKIDTEVRRLVDQALTQCRNLLTEKKHEVGLVAEELLSKEVIGRDDMVRLLGKRPFEDNKEFTKYFDGGKSAPPPPPLEGASAETTA